jgi:hypothetical protein
MDVQRLQEYVSQAKISDEALQVKNEQASKDILCLSKERNEIRNELEKEAAKYMVLFSLHADPCLNI